MDSGSPFQTVCAAEEKRCAAVLVRELDTVSKSISADLSSMARQVWLQCVEQIAWLMEPVCFVAQGGDIERNAASDGKPMQITKAINGVLLTCGYIADDSSKLVLDYLYLVERLLSGII